MSLIYNKKLLREWFDYIVPELQNDEVLIGILCARKKYSDKISRSEEILDKVILKSDKDSNIRRLTKFLRIEEGDYIDFKTGEPIPLEAMVAYLDLYPKSTLKAISTWNKTVLQWMSDAIINPEFELRVFRKIDTKLFSSIAKSNSRKPVRILDVDDQNLERYFGKGLPKPDWVTRTRGGYHLIYFTPTKEKEREVSKELYEKSKNFDLIEIQWHQGQTVIPGTLQGGVEVEGWIGR